VEGSIVGIGEITAIGLRYPPVSVG